MTDPKDRPSDGPFCAHLHVSWKTRPAEDGLTEGWWACDACGTPFLANVEAGASQFFTEEPASTPEAGANAEAHDAESGSPASIPDPKDRPHQNCAICGDGDVYQGHREPVRMVEPPRFNRAEQTVSVHVWLCHKCAARLSWGM